MRKLTYEEVKEYIDNEGYKLLSTEYKNNKTKLKIMCNKNHIFEMKFNSFKSGQRCPKCNGTQKLTYEEVKEYINNEGYELLSTKYINNRTKLKIKCNEGHIFEMNFNNFKDSGARCPYCSNNAKYKYEEVKEYIESFGYELLSKEYINNNTKLKIMCDKGHIYETCFKVFKKEFRCPYCSNNAKYTIEFVREYLKSFKYTLLSEEYINTNTHIKIMCPEGHIYEATFAEFKNHNRRCPICNASKGEKRIEEILKKLNIKFKVQYRFENCKFYKTLPFDFYITDYNICIEYDGVQHYKVIDYFGGLDGFIDTKIRDTIKDKYCEDNNIALIRIPYWNFDDIENILTKELINNSLKIS